MSVQPKRRAPPRSVVDVMHRDVVSVRPDATLADLARLLQRRGVSGVPVVEEDGTAIGVVSATDLLWLSDQIRPSEQASRPGTALWERKVREVMTPDVFGIAPDASIEELLEFFSRTGLHRALVLEGTRVVGIVSATDVLWLIAEHGLGPRGSG